MARKHVTPAQYERLRKELRNVHKFLEDTRTELQHLRASVELIAGGLSDLALDSNDPDREAEQKFDLAAEIAGGQAKPKAIETAVSTLPDWESVEDIDDGEE